MNILIIKVGALGDVVRCSFLAQALKDKYSAFNPKIYWLTQEKAKMLFVNNPYVSKVILLENKKALRNINFDLIVNLEEEKELCLFTSSLNHKKLIGFSIKENQVFPTPSAKEWFDMSAMGKKPQNDILKKENKKTHRQIMSEIVGVDYRKYEPFLRLTNVQRTIAKNFLRRYNLSEKEMIIGINAGAADRWPKALPVGKTAKLIDLLHKKFNAKIILFGGPNEVERNTEIMRLAESPVINAGCGNDLFEFPALVSLCKIFVTTDSLGLHIALALKRRIICLLGPTSISEIDLYGFGKKIVAKSKCVCCYKPDCKSMDKIDLNEIVSAVSSLKKQKITILITAFKEPKLAKAIESALNQKTGRDYDIIVSAPDKKTLAIAKKYAKKHPKIKIFQDSGKGKSYALNLIFSRLSTDILVLTDGDVFISENAIEEITNLFSDPEIGCVSGRPVPLENMETKFGYWANFLFGAAHRLRRESFQKNGFIECSGYLFAFRKKVIEKIPLDVAEDTIIPYYFWEKGYRIGYAPEARVFVKNVNNLKDWIKQKIRTSKAHETLNKYVDTLTTPRTKTFLNEFLHARWLLGHPRNMKEFFWAAQLAFFRFYMWFRVIFETKIKERGYTDAWERIESTK